MPTAFLRISFVYLNHMAKDNLAADVRVETERRQKALEADLRLAQASKKERSFALRYHKIKFFGESSLNCARMG